MTVPQLIHGPLKELAHRVNDGLEVTLLWQPDTGELNVRVCDVKRGANFDIQAEPARALDVFYHPYSYAAVEDERLAA